MTRTDSAARVVHASPAAIYRALLDPDALVTWLPPAGMRAELHSFDPRSGYTMALVYETPPDGGGKSASDRDEVDVRFVERVTDERLVQRITFDGLDGAMTMTWSLVPVDGGTRVEIVASDVPAAISKEDHDAGLRSSLDNLAAYVTSAARASTTA